MTKNTNAKLVFGIYVTEGSDFLRLNDPYKIDLFDGESKMVINSYVELNKLDGTKRVKRVFQ